jgi:glyoxylase-like metal-dependent hydrolase (beta-lactamase superfamily II)
MQIRAFFDPATYTLTYVVYDEATRDAVVIDPVWDYDPKSSSTDTKSLDELVAFLQAAQLNVHLVLETHAHADHLSGAKRLVEHFPNAKVGIGARITLVQKTFQKAYNLPDTFRTDGSQFDLLLEDNQVVSAGSLDMKTLFTPGHTPACVSYLIGDAVFTGDLIFMPDYGTGRCDFPAGSAEDMYNSIVERIYTLPDNTRVFTGHDYVPGGRQVLYESTVGEQKTSNIMLRAGIPKETFVSRRKSRDATLAAPVLLFPSVQVNIAAGELPEPESNGLSYLKIPVNLFATRR